MVGWGQGSSARLRNQGEPKPGSQAEPWESGTKDGGPLNVTPVWGRDPHTHTPGTPGLGLTQSLVFVELCSHHHHTHKHTPGTPGLGLTQFLAFVRLDGHQWELRGMGNEVLSPASGAVGGGCVVCRWGLL